MRHPKVGRVGSLGLAICIGWGWQARAQVADGLECYTVSDPLRLGAVVDVGSAESGLQSGCVVSSRRRLFCTPATKSVVSATDPKTGAAITPLPFSAAPVAGQRICYKVKCPVSAPPVSDQVVTDQFGTRTVGRFTAAMVCTPATKGAAFCGDGDIGAGEDCDGTDLGGASCATLGYRGGGTLSCTPGCAYDTSGCARQAFPATGQTTCWDAEGVVIPCGGTGQDGDVRAGAALAYTDNGDGTITDLGTRLVWEKKSDDLSIHDKDILYAWEDAFTVHVAGLNAARFGGHDDWRVPNVKELESIVDYQEVSPSVSPAFNTGCAPGCTVLSCSCTQPTVYWASTSTPSPSYAWSVLFYGGNVAAYYKDERYFVRAVRGGS